MWSIKVRYLAGNKCEFCGEESSLLDAHHLLSRNIKNSALKWNVMNGIALCKGNCHKFGKNSFHKNPIVTSKWLEINHPKKHQYIMMHHNDIINQNDRNVLKQIEMSLCIE